MNTAAKWDCHQDEVKAQLRAAGMRALGITDPDLYDSLNVRWWLDAEQNVMVGYQNAVGLIEQAQVDFGGAK